MRGSWVLVLGLVGLVGCGSEALPPAQEPALVGCEQRELLLVDRASVVRVDGNGASTELFRFGATLGLSPDDLVVNQWQTAGEFAAANAFLYRPGAGNSYEFVVFDKSGAVRFHSVETHQANPTMHLGSDGSLAIASDTSGRVAFADGKVVDLGKYQPLGPHNHGHIAVADGPAWSEDAPRGFLTLSGLAFTPFAASARYAPMAIERDRLYYVSTIGAPRLVVAASPKDTFEIPLPGEPMSYYSLRVQSEGRYVLVFGDNQTTVFLVDTDAKTATPLALGDISRGQATYGMWPQAVDEKGRVIAAVKVNDLLQARRSSDAGKTWIDVGGPMTPGPDLGYDPWIFPMAHGDGVLLLNLSTGYGHSLNDVQMATPAGHTTVAAGGLYLNYDMAQNGGQATLSRDGQCGASWVLSPNSQLAESPSYDLALFDGKTTKILRSAAAEMTNVVFRE